MGDKIRTGILGCGTAAQLHAKALRECPERELVGAYSPDTQGLCSFAEEYGIKAFSGREEMFAACECIHICTPSGMHFADSMECLQQGKHVICEKPVCMTTEECEKLLEALSKTEAGFMPIAQSRYADGYRQIKEALQNGVLGNVIGAVVEVMYYRSSEYYRNSPWRGSKKEDGGVIMNQAIHYVDMVIGLLGDPRCVTASASNKLHPIEAPDTVSALVEFESGTTATFMLSTAAYPGYPGKYMIFGTKGSVQVEEGTIHWQLEESREEVKGVTGHTGFKDPGGINLSLHPRQFREFSDVIRQGAKQAYDAAEAVKAVKLIQAVFRSAEEGRKVYLTEEETV